MSTIRDIYNDIIPYRLREVIFLLRYGEVKTVKDILLGKNYSGGHLSKIQPFYQHKCIFVHIPKTAGTSVCRAFFGVERIGHSTIFQYKSMMKKEDFNSFFKFTFVRNPFDRLLSAYVFLKKGGVEKSDQEFFDKHLGKYASFEDFVLNWVTVSNVNNIFLASCPHFRPQHEYVYKDGKCFVDFVGKTENIAEDTEKIASRIGKEVKLGVHNQSRAKESRYQDFYTSEMIDVVSKVYKKDLELFGYSFE